MSITFEQFEEQIDSIESEYCAKYNELSKLRSQFQKLANQITLDHIEDEDERDDLRDEISDRLGELAYTFDLEWDGFVPGNTQFWVPSTC
ncbi:hypothetical protein [Xanthomonas phage BUDD]|nr:hypothetical protein [Xanthomonas phage BUDD]